MRKNTVRTSTNIEEPERAVGAKEGDSGQRIFNMRNGCG
jgi:hypothetical protein